MELSTLLFLILLLACPLSMLFMHRGHGGHGSRGKGHGHGHAELDQTEWLGELRRRRAGLDTEIARLEQAETEVGDESAARPGSVEHCEPSGRSPNAPNGLGG